MNATAKKLLSLVLAVVMALSVLPATVFATNGADGYDDIGTGDWYREAVEYVREHGLMVGVGGGKFAPAGVTTRAMVVTVLHRMEDTPEAEADAFTDVEADAWYTDAVTWARANNIVNGYGDNTFHPAAPMTREEMITVFYRYSQYKGYDVSAAAELSEFSDSDQILPYAEDSMAWAVAEGLFRGFPDGTIRPQGESNRAQLAIILMRYVIAQNTNSLRLPADLAALLGLDPNAYDTDGDGLSDYHEVRLTGTDPALADTDEDGISDDAEDSDGDTLTNLEEVNLGTDPLRDDSDADGLNDYDEICVYGTSALAADTDSDGLNDADEIRLGLNPLIQCTDGRTLDSERIFTQELKASNIRIVQGRGAMPSLTVTGASAISNTLKITESSARILGGSRAVIGDPIEIRGADFAEGSLSFAVSDLKTGEALVICRYTDGGIEHLDTTRTGSTLTARIDGCGTYFVLDTDALAEIGPAPDQPVLNAAADSDYDGVPDSKEKAAKRKDNSFSGTMLGYYNIADATYTFDYLEFFNSATTYSNDISSASLMLANAIYDDCGFVYDDGRQITDIVEMMEYHGFEDVVDYKMVNGFNNGTIKGSAYKDDNVSEVCIGHHTVTYNGKTKTILGIVIRGTNGTVQEWSSNFDMGDPDVWTSKHHKGFYTTEKRIRSFVNSYVAAYVSGAPGLTYWITGHSRGAALANLLAANMVDKGNSVYAYTFATPTTTTSTNMSKAKYNCIFNWTNVADVVTYLPLKEWNFGRFGVTYSDGIVESGLESEWCAQTGAPKFNALTKSSIELGASRIKKSCCATWGDVHTRDDNQDIDDAQYACISARAKRYCGFTERFTLFTKKHNGWKLHASTAFVFQLGAEMLGGSAQEQNNVKSLISEFWNSKFSGLLLLFVGDAIWNWGSFSSMELGESLVGDGHSPATYYVLINN